MGLDFNFALSTMVEILTRIMQADGADIESLAITVNVFKLNNVKEWETFELIRVMMKYKRILEIDDEG